MKAVLKDCLCDVLGSYRTKSADMFDRNKHCQPTHTVYELWKQVSSSRRYVVWNLRI